MIPAPVTNNLGQPIGQPLPHWKECKAPTRSTMKGRFCRLEPLDATLHAKGLMASFSEDSENRIWTYLPTGPFNSFQEFEAWAKAQSQSKDPLFFVIVDKESGDALGVASYLRITPPTGVIEVGHINFGPRLQKTALATEAMYLMMKHIFSELGYRRYEWKCDALNAPSRRAAERLGFRFEGIFRNATIYKGRSRDTAWYSIVDSEWPKLEAGFETWLEDVEKSGSLRQARPLSAYF